MLRISFPDDADVARIGFSAICIIISSRSKTGSDVLVKIAGHHRPGRMHKPDILPTSYK